MARTKQMKRGNRNRNKFPSKGQNRSGEDQHQQGSNDRRLLFAVEHCVPMAVWHVLGQSDEFLKANAVEPLKVVFLARPEASLLLTFDLRKKEGGDEPDAKEVEVSVKDLVGVRSTTSLCIQASLEWHEKVDPPSEASSSSWFPYLADSNRAKWEDAPKRLETTLTGEGSIGKVDLSSLRFLAVRLEVYMVHSPKGKPQPQQDAAKDGVKDEQANTSPPDEDMEEDGADTA